MSTGNPQISVWALNMTLNVKIELFSFYTIRHETCIEILPVGITIIAHEFCRAVHVALDTTKMEGTTRPLKPQILFRLCII